VKGQLTGLRSGALGWIGALALLLALAAPAHGATYQEDAVKAAFLYRFAAYVTWPPRPPDATFTIAVLGSETVAAQLERLLPHLRIQNRAAAVRRIASVEALGDEQILYVAAGQHLAAKTLAEKARAHSILVVTDDAGGLGTGAAINFVHVGRNLRFEISMTEAERDGLKINSGLLAVATRVERNGS